jgi:hypothetical protein
MTIPNGNPKAILEQLYKDRYGEAKAIFWTGSVSQSTHTDRSDLDIVVTNCLNIVSIKI